MASQVQLGKLCPGALGEPLPIHLLVSSACGLQSACRWEKSNLAMSIGRSRIKVCPTRLDTGRASAKEKR